MTNQEILERSIKLAIDGGWRGDMLDIKVEQQDNGIVRVYWDDTEWSVLDILYNKAFARGLWKGRVFSKYPGMDIGNEREQSAWQYHLQQLVIADDVFKYLEEHAL